MYAHLTILLDVFFSFSIDIGLKTGNKIHFPHMNLGELHAPYTVYWGNVFGDICVREYAICDEGKARRGIFKLLVELKL